MSAPEAGSGGSRPERPRYTLTEFVHGGGWRGSGRRTPPLLFGPAISALAFATVGFLFAAVVTASWTGDSIYRHTDYGALSLASLRDSEARLKPYEVARRQSQNGLNSPTERPTNLHIVRIDGELRWTSVRDPDGFFRVLSKPTRGVMSVAATSTAPDGLQAISSSLHCAEARAAHSPGGRSRAIISAFRLRLDQRRSSST